MNISIPTSYLSAAVECLSKAPGFPSDQIDLYKAKSADNPTDHVDIKLFFEILIDLNANYEHAGLHFARHMPLTAHGPLSSCILSAKNISQIIDALQSYTQSRVKILALEVIKKERTTRLEYRPEINLASNWHLLQECIFATIYFNLEFLFDDQIYPTKVGLTQQLPDSTIEFHYFEKTQVLFGQDRFYLEFDNSVLDKSARFNNPELFEISEQLCEDLLEKNLSSNTFVEQVYTTLLRSDLLLSIEEVAHNLGLSERSLRNRLKEEGTNFQKINRQAKLDKAVSLLSSSNHSIQSISEQMGYRDVASFSSAFKKWSGSSPLHIRKSL